LQRSILRQTLPIKINLLRAQRLSKSALSANIAVIAGTAVTANSIIATQVTGLLMDSAKGSIACHKIKNRSLFYRDMTLKTSAYSYQMSIEPDKL
jgi:hypothetical protein